MTPIDLTDDSYYNRSTLFKKTPEFNYLNRMYLKSFIKSILYPFVGLTSLLAYSHLENRWLKTTEILIESPDLPLSFVNKRIVFIADIHHGPFFSLKRVESLVNCINKPFRTYPWRTNDPVWILGTGFIDPIWQ
jgi:hypothetical protein